MHRSIDNYAIIEYHMLTPSLQTLDLKSLTGLLFLLEERNVGRAAERLHISQPAMSRLLQRLREAFDDTLFVRTARGMTPTPAALTLEFPVRQMLAKMASISGQRFDPATTARNFRLFAPASLTQACTPFIAAALSQHAPHATLTADLLTDDNTATSPIFDADAVLSSEYYRVPAGYETEILGEDQMVCVMSKDNPLASKDIISLDNYLSARHVYLDSGSTSRSVINSALGERARERDFGLKTQFLPTALEAVGCTNLLLSTNQLFVEQFVATFNLAIRPLPFRFPATRFYLGWPKSSSDDLGGKWFREYCRKFFSIRIKT